MLGNHETGVRQPIEELSAICHDQGVYLHSDGVQAVGKIAVDFRAMGAAALTVSAHKFHGPCGIGALLVRHDVPLSPLLSGGFQQQGVRPGTEPVALALGMFKALEIWSREADERRQRMSELRDRLEQLVRGECPDVVVNGRGAERLPHVSNLAFPGVDRQALAITLDLAGIACSTGSACASGSSEPSHVLRAMGLPDEVVQGSVRFSLSALTTTAEVTLAVQRIVNAVNHLRSLSRARKAAGTSRQNTPEAV
jgi:cysteine desulfurase